MSSATVKAVGKARVDSTGVGSEATGTMGDKGWRSSWSMGPSMALSKRHFEMNLLWSFVRGSTRGSNQQPSGVWEDPFEGL